MSISTHRFSRSLPRFAAVAAALVGLVNIASALTPNIRWRGHLLLQLEPVQAIRLFHASALPAGTALLMVAPYLARRRRRAWQVAIVLGVPPEQARMVMYDVGGNFGTRGSFNVEFALVCWAAKRLGRRVVARRTE